jgi:hypothetical protein
MRIGAAAQLRVSASSRMIALKPDRLRIGSGRSPVPRDAERLDVFSAHKALNTSIRIPS